MRHVAQRTCENPRYGCSTGEALWQRGVIWWNRELVYQPLRRLQISGNVVISSRRCL